MTGEQLSALESRLWTAADQLRANSKLTATEYSFPVLGIIFLRHAHSRFKLAKVEIEKSLPVHPVRGVRPIDKNDFLTAKAIFLPEESRWDNILDLPESVDIGEHINKSMKSIEEEYPNPFSDFIQINYGVFQKAKVSIQVFDIQGNLVAKLQDLNLKPEKYTAEWKPDSNIISGHYFVALKINDVQVHYLKVIKN